MTEHSIDLHRYTIGDKFYTKGSQLMEIMAMVGMHCTLKQISGPDWYHPDGCISTNGEAWSYSPNGDFYWYGGGDKPEHMDLSHVATETNNLFTICINHDWVDTGMTKSWCKHCNIDARWIDGQFVMCEDK